jgi:antitoxin component YwqK of YwqJK toxin-antitoxin module
MHASLAVLVAALSLMPAAASAERNASLAGQSLVEKIPGGEHRREYASNGQMIYEVVERRSGKGLEAIEREWTQEGTPLREQKFLGGTQMQATFWYMNGQIKEKHTNQALRDPKGLPGDYVEYFSDLGLPQASGVMQGKFRRVGVHRFYDEQGKLKAEVTYDASGNTVSEKKFDAEGNSGGTQGFYPDGSRRLQ